MRAIGISLSLLALVGCSSFRTSAIDRCENDTLVVNPTCPLKGIPVALRIPTHLELSVVETTYWEKKFISGQRPTLVPLASCRATRTVVHHVQETEKIFLVDPVRPGSGTESYGFAFQSAAGDSAAATSQGNGYLRSVTYKIDDTTITDSAKLLANSLGMISALQTGANNPVLNSDTLIATDNVVAFSRFDINSPTFECDVAAFLECNVTRAASSDCPKVCKELRCQTP